MKKKNLIVFSLNGTMLMPTEDMVGFEGPVTEEYISNTFFHTDDLSKIKYTKITRESFDSCPNENLDKDPIRIYYSSSSTEIWNYNSIMSAIMGELIYSNVIIFVSDSEIEGNDSSFKMNSEEFTNIVAGYIQACSQVIQEVSLKNTMEEEKAAQSKRSPLFQISDIKFIVAEDPLYTETISIEGGKRNRNLDEYWKKKYSGKCFSDFIFDCVGHDTLTGETFSAYLLMQPSFMTVYAPSSGDVKIYTSQYDREVLSKVAKQIYNLNPKMSLKDLEKEKEKIMKPLYS